MVRKNTIPTITPIGVDSYTAADHPLLGFWNTNTNGIRKCNQFLTNAKASVVGNAQKDGDDNKLYDRYCAEAKLMRAIFHFELICWFGDAPIIGEDEAGAPIVFDLSNPSAMNMERTPAAQALEWVVAQCDEVKDLLPFRYANEGSNWGRVNGATAYALKSRALLYRASDLYSSSDKATWWKKAATAATDFMQKNTQQSNPYQLYNTSDPTNDYYTCFITNPVFNSEFIMARSVWNTYQIENAFLPVGFTGKFTANGRTNPTQNFVDAFEMKDGKFIDENGSTYDKANPFRNRDPRLDQIVFHQGSIWGRADLGEQRSIDVRYISETNKGLDYKTAMAGTITGYYLKKYVNNISSKEPSTFPHAWAIFRYGEILLNAAEAINEAEGPTNAYQYINQIRTRAGMPPYAGMTQAELKKRIRNERRIELSFEDHRFFDVRRWMLFEGVTATNELSKPRYEQLLNLWGVRVTGTQEDPKYDIQRAEANSLRIFNTPKNYRFPLPADEVKRAPKLKQNPGWDVGSSSNGRSVATQQ